MALISRRNAIKLGIAGVAGVAAARWSFKAFSAADELSAPERDAMRSVAESFLRSFDAPGLSVAIAHAGKLIYEEAFGKADRESTDPLTTSNLFRIASVSKPITSAGIFTLIDQGKLNRMDAVFGTASILGTDFGTPPFRPYVTEITVDHLLTHTAGGWSNDATDPMFHAPSELSQRDLVSWTLDNRALDYPPGQHYAYSNFGYFVLGRVIEKISQMAYDEYIRERVLAPCGVQDMRIGGSTLSERAANEVVYYAQSNEDPYGMNVARMDSAGGWLATASDLAHFAAKIGGTANGPGLLSRDSIVRMGTPGPGSSPSAEIKYARGWNVRNDGRGNWWHVGSLPGTTSVVTRTARGFCWAALTNTRRQPHDEIDLALDNMMWEMVRKAKRWNV